MSKALGTILKLAVTVLILVLIATQLDFRAVARTLSAIPLPVFIAAFLVVLAQAVGSAKRLSMVVARFGAVFRVRDSVRVTLEGVFFSQTFISFLGGDALRIWRIRKLGLPLAEATSAVALDRLIGILTNHIFLLLSLPWLLSVIDDVRVRTALIVLAVTGVAGFAAILLVAALRGRVGFLHKLRAIIPSRRLATLIVEASSVGKHFMTQHRHLALVVAVSFLISVANMIVFGLILLGMGTALPVALGCALLVPAVLEISMLPISIAGWGLREGAAVVAFGTMGLPLNNALGCSLAFGLLGVSVSLIGGALWLADRRAMAEISIDSDRPNVR